MDDDGDSVGGATRWDELGERLLSQTRGDSSIGHLQDEVNVLVLRTVDPANRKAIYHRKTNAAEFWKAAERWKAALSNAPDWLGFPLPEKGKSEIVPTIGLRRAAFNHFFVEEALRERRSPHDSKRSEYPPPMHSRTSCVKATLKAHAPACFVSSFEGTDLC